MHYTIGKVTEMTGLSGHTIRAWERRHQVLSPTRTETNRRLYGDEDVLRLQLLRELVQRGHSIRQIANLETEELAKAVARETVAQNEGSDADNLTPYFSAIEYLDSVTMENLLVTSSARIGLIGTIERIIVPLLEEIGRRWTAGRTTVAQEHLATGIIRRFLDNARGSFQSPSRSLQMVVTTPAGQLHELGALMVAVIASVEGWNVIYLGPNLPASEIVDAAVRSAASVVSLSVVYPIDDPKLGQELKTIRDRLGPSTHLLVGGRGVPFYEEEVAAASALPFESVSDLRITLLEIASRGRRA